MLLAKLCLLLAVSLLCLGQTHGEKQLPMALYTINLDLPPEQRWLPLLRDFKSSAPLVVKYFYQQAPKIVNDLLKVLMADLDGYFGELGQEMKAIADYWEVDLGIVVSLNLAYVLRRLGGGHPNTTGNVTNSQSYGAGFGEMACTSIVAQDATGNIYHGRNLDWDIPDYLRNLTVQADFVKNGEPLFTADVTAGFVGILTGMSVHGFSISVNERDLGGNIVEDALEALLKHSSSPTHLTRQVLTSATSYDEAVAMLGTKPVTAPVYYITAGSLPNQGAVLTRDRNALADVVTLNAPDLQQEPADTWYLLQTNYDRWKQPDANDNRRVYGHLYMESVGQEAAAQFDGLLSVLSTWPLTNSYTSYTAVMMPGEFDMESFDVYT
ncbi:N-acylethanolamine-hydrolyzing acid amidase-like [Halichondria panicea]|uniref:N-acylethanolamine-hydrolyzing acid amidase-like n=1 Tax=Halichondria panicea TaxID=6063 RepID=UPI00312BA033